jgi:hypothetical protein
MARWCSTRLFDNSRPSTPRSCTGWINTIRSPQTSDDGDHRTIENDRNNDVSEDNPWRVPARYDVTGTPFPIPVNGLAERGSGMMSYPNFLRPSRPLQYPDLHLLYRACRAARVNCGHVYLHRDPRGIIGTYKVVVRRRTAARQDEDKSETHSLTKFFFS